ncbi:hypothetical protein K2173_007971 [Erythroxylum novogranatense]|uniref:Pentatricopeptide repeat-containing protein n=1 Tax=Erythroxylum novogranatense TaxID=1862640 RepID=A0AAV8T6Y2_9ROSI|nr:hypothetical protein K2173_007971 [Erythroxylum novogranatense]
MKLNINGLFSMSSARGFHHQYPSFCASFSTTSASSPRSSLLQLSKATSRELNEPPKFSVETQRKTKFITHECAINLIKREKDPQHALQIFNRVGEQKGFNHNHATYSIMLHKLAQAKKFKAVDALLHQMTYETCKFHESIFLILMKHFSKSRLHDKVLEMFNKIQPVTREKPSLKAISTCLNLLVESKKVDLALDFLLCTNRHLKLKPNTCIFNILVKHHCKSGDVESAAEVVKEMKKSQISYPNLITYSTLLAGLCESGRLKEAMDLFEEMVSKDQILPDVLTYNILIDGFCRGGKVNGARRIMDFMKTNGCEPNLFNYTALMNGFCREGRLEDAKQIFDELKSIDLRPDTVGYTALINGYCRAGKLDEAMKLLKEMKEANCRADLVTFNVVLGGLCREERFEEALEMLVKLPNQGVYLNSASYRIVLNFLCQKGELEKAIALLSLMLGRGFWPHHATSNDLLVRLCKAGIVDDAIMALFRLLETGFMPEPDTWAFSLETVCRERKLLPAFQLLDELVQIESGESFSHYVLFETSPHLTK